MTIYVQDVPVTRTPWLRLAALAVVMAGAAVLAACSTTEGFGKDVKNLGGDIEESAAENK
ncbi:MAG: hypothetical protein ACKVS8_00200 [Phycisphaerales bacterium]